MILGSVDGRYTVDGVVDYWALADYCPTKG